jgi:hypothetical protein
MKPLEVFNEIVTACEEQGKKLAVNNAKNGIFEPLYLYFRPAQETVNGELLFVSDSDKAPEGFELATGEGLRGNIPYSEYWAWIRQRSTRLPILAWK